MDLHILLDSVQPQELHRVHDGSGGRYGARKVYHQLRRDGVLVDGTPVAKCTVERLMAAEGLAGARRGRSVRTTRPDTAAARPADLVNREFTAVRPNQLWVVDFTYVATFAGFVYVSFAVDVFSRMIVGWRAARTMATELPLDALDMALWHRGRAGHSVDGLIHHSDAGSQYTAIRYTVGHRLPHPGGVGRRSSIGGRDRRRVPANSRRRRRATAGRGRGGGLLSQRRDRLHAVLGLAQRKLSRPIRAFTIVFANEHYNEQKLAQRAADWVGATFVPVPVDQHDLAEAFSDALWHALLAIPRGYTLVGSLRVSGAGFSNPDGAAAWVEEVPDSATSGDLDLPAGQVLAAVLGKC